MHPPISATDESVRDPQRAARRTSVFASIAEVALLAIGYLVLARLSIWFQFDQLNVSAVWLPAGLMLAAAILRGARVLPGAALGALVDELTRSTPLLAAVGVAAGVVAGAAAGAAALRRVPRFNPALEEPRHVVVLVAVGATLAPVISAAIGVTALAVAGRIPWPQVLGSAACWAAGDALGIVLLTTLLLAWTRTRPDAAAGIASDWRMRSTLALLQTLIVTVIFLLPQHALGTTPSPLATFPVAVILAALLPLRWVAAMNCLVFAASAATTVAGFGPFAGDTLNEGFVPLAVYNLLFCTTTLVVASLALERDRVAGELTEALERARGLSALSADWYWEQDEELRFVTFSAGMEEKSGSDPDLSLGKTRFELPFKWDSEAVKRKHERDLAARRTFRELHLIRTDDDGTSRHLCVSGAPVFDRSGAFRGYRGIGRDVTEERQAITALRESEARLRSLVGMSVDWMWEQDENLRYTYFSGGIPEKAGVQESSSLGKTRFEVRFEWASEEIKRAHAHDLEARRSFRDLKLKRVDDNGRVRHTSVSGDPIFDAEGRFRGYRGVAHDITEVTLATEALRESEARFRSLVELSNDWFWEQDEELRFTRVEGATDEVQVPRLQGLLGKRRWDFPFFNMTEADWDEHKRLLAERRSFRDLELAGWDDGERFHVLASGEPVFDATGRFRGYRGTSRDVTAARRAEEKAQRLSRMYAMLSEANHAIIHARNPVELYGEVCRLLIEHGRFVFCSVITLDPATGAAAVTACAGNDESELARLPLFDPDAADAIDPAAQAFRTGTQIVVNDIATDERTAAWRDTLQACAVQATALLPLRPAGEIAGALQLHSAQAGVFDEDLVALLEKLALNISFALDNFARDAARRAAENALHENQTRLRDFTEAAAEFVWETDPDGFITFISSQVETISGFSSADLIGKRARELMPLGEAERVADWLATHRKPNGSFRDLEYRVVARSGQVRWLRLNSVPILDEHGARSGWRGTGADITDRRAAEDRITYLATRDPLTELPNRTLLADRMSIAIGAAQRSQRALAALFIDLDRFKNINDSLGHEIGDLVLKGTAARLVGCVREGDTLARLGGDEFVIVLEKLRHAEDAAQVAAKVLAALSHPFEIAGHSLTTSCSIGISIFPHDAGDERTLMRNADIAMYHAKERGRGNYQFFAPDMNERAVERLNLESAMRQALERDEFLLHYQPQLDMRSGRIVGVEALIRWQHPTRGLLPPGKFIPVAEDTGFIEQLGEWTLVSAFEQARVWAAAGLPPIKMAVNISARQLRKPAEFCRKVMDTIERTGVDPAAVELEMTESLLLQNADENISALKRLGEQRVRIAVDDFGTGYSSLSYLKQLPIHTLKIDRSFTHNLPNDREGAAIVQAIIGMGHSLGLRVNAEGVETQEQLALLRTMACDEYQGFLFSRPIAAEDMAALLRKEPRLTSPALQLIKSGTR